MHFVKKHSRLILILVGTFVWSLTMFKSGLTYNFGLGFWGANGHDAIWHIAVSNSLAGGSLGMPVFAGEQIKNYHLGFNLLLAGFHLVTRIPLSALYFQIFPPVIAFLFGTSLFALVRQWKGSNGIALLAVFFGYFGGSWGWLVSLFRNGGFSGESMFWSQQSISTLINPPFALSLVILSQAVRFLHRFTISESRRDFWLTALLFGLLPLIKVYAGLLALSGLAVVVVFDLIKHKKTGTLKLFFVTLAISLLVFLPLNKNSTNLIIFQPFWFLDSMLSVSDRFHWPRLYSAVTTYRQSGDIFRLLAGYGLAFTLFIVGNLGTRIIGLNVFKSLKKFTAIDYFLATVLAAGIVVPTLFLQSGTPWNTIQFLYYSLFVMNIFAAISFFDLLKHTRDHSIRPLLLALLIVLTIPTTLDSLNHYLPSRPPAMVSKGEMEALRFLSGQAKGVVLEYPISQNPYAPAPRPLYLYESTAYVSAFSGQPSYLADTVNLNITGYNWPDRLSQIKKFVVETSATPAREFLTNNDITYIYLADVSEYQPKLSAAQLGGTVIFENSQAAIWKVK